MTRCFFLVGLPVVPHHWTRFDPLREKEKKNAFLHLQCPSAVPRYQAESEREKDDDEENEQGVRCKTKTKKKCP